MGEKAQVGFSPEYEYLMTRDSLETPIRYLKGVGPKRANLFKKLGVETVEDLLYLAPRRYIDRRFIKSIREIRAGEEATVFGEVLTKGLKKVKDKKIFTVVLYDGNDWMELTWFNLPLMEKYFKKGDKVIASGKVTYFRGVKQIAHPEVEILEDDKDIPQWAGKIIPVYPATEGLKPRFIRKLVYEALKYVEGKVEETIPGFIGRKRNLFSRWNALRKLHFPQSFDEAKKARDTLAYEEFFQFFLQLGHRKVERKWEGIPLKKNGELTEKLLKNLRFELTGAQKRVKGEIEKDMERKIPMHRLLQGDVGSGKTVVALYAMLLAVENGYQAAMMAPTEILAEQHFIVLSDYLYPLGVRTVILVGGMRKRERELVLKEVETGQADIVVGTHALIQEQVKFKNLAMAVVDEQHKFGVMQRARLLEKGENNIVPHFLVMTATPIPRTLALTLYGDLDISVLDEKPPGRGEIVTVWRRENKRGDIYRWVFDKVKEGAQAYIVAPLIEKSDKLEVEAAEELYKKLKEMVPPSINLGLIHGRMKKEERRSVMEAFRRGEFGILVSTTVIEVGIDVENATIMVIEHAERFGLAQLHQLRGRIGRGAKRSYCILITPNRVSDDAKRRLSTLTETNDGFKIAEVDLEIRGPGEFFGTRQHGLPQFRIADLLRDQRILMMAKRDAEEIYLRDPQLVLEEHKIIAQLLKRLKEKEKLYVG
jgi:ATP-dependent DNA helicase RecG